MIDEVARLATIGTDILMETGAVISAKPFPAGSHGDSSLLMRVIQRQGRALRAARA